jgi:hypothetical protein
MKEKAFSRLGFYFSQGCSAKSFLFYFVDIFVITTLIGNNTQIAVKRLEGSNNEWEKNQGQSFQSRCWVYRYMVLT